MEVFSKYLTLCFTCCRKKKKTRKEIRAEWRERQNANDLNGRESPKLPTETVAIVKTPEIKFNGIVITPENIKGVVKLQALVRGFLGKIKSLRRWVELLEEANEYWRYIQWQRDEAKRIKLLREQAIRDVSALLSDSMSSLFLIFSFSFFSFVLVYFPIYLRCSRYRFDFRHTII
jgi:hypothetical protein